MLDMPKHDRAWHEQDVEDELQEFREAEGFLARWSEKSDVVYTYTRAQWSGHALPPFPLGAADFAVGAAYMFPKYTLRWLFFYLLGKRFGRNNKITEVRNPRKTTKLRDIAERNNIDPAEFEAAARRLSRFWPFLP